MTNDKVKKNDTGSSLSSEDSTKLKIRLRDLWWYIAIMAIFTVFVAYRLISPGVKVGFSEPAFDMTVADYGFDLSNLSVDASVVVPSGFKTDGLKALVDPEFIKGSEAAAFTKKQRRKEHTKFIVDNDRVIGVTIDGESRAYPIRIMNWHEIANDTLGGVPIAVTYSPLTDSVVVFNRRLDPDKPPLEFCVSGLLYNSNLLMYDSAERDDREGSSLWSQLLMKSVAGPKCNVTLYAFPAQLMRWRDWLAAHPDTTVITGTPAGKENYNSNPYQTYYVSATPKFPVKPMAKSDDHAWMKPIVVIASGGETTAFFHVNPPDDWQPTAENTRAGGTAYTADVTVGDDKFMLKCRPPTLRYDAETAEVVWDGSRVSVEEGNSVSDEAANDIGDIDSRHNTALDLHAPDYIIHAFYGAWYAMYPDTKFVTP